MPWTFDNSNVHYKFIYNTSQQRVTTTLEIILCFGNVTYYNIVNALFEVIILFSRQTRMFSYNKQNVEICENRLRLYRHNVTRYQPHNLKFFFAADTDFVRLG